eukprot:scaffold704_cov347-Prasinococcus_capsulatus_cf.AAC.43
MMLRVRQLQRPVIANPGIAQVQLLQSGAPFHHRGQRRDARVAKLVARQIQHPHARVRVMQRALQRPRPALANPVATQVQLLQVGAPFQHRGQRRGPRVVGRASQRTQQRAALANKVLIQVQLLQGAALLQRRGQLRRRRLAHPHASKGQGGERAADVRQHVLRQRPRPLSRHWMAEHPPESVYDLQCVQPPAVAQRRAQLRHRRRVGQLALALLNNNLRQLCALSRRALA